VIFIPGEGKKEGPIMKVLLIEDDAFLLEFLSSILQKNRYVVEKSQLGEEGLYLAEQYPYDAIILDVMLPDMNGFELLSRLRAKKIRTPVMFLTDRRSVEDRVEGLELGADDYLSKPVELKEFLARLTSLIRRGKNEPFPVVCIADLQINTSSRSVLRNHKEITLTPMEFNLLEYLVMNAGRVVTRTELYEHLYHRDFDSDSNLIDVYISYLRNKIDKPYPNKLIHTKRGAGFMVSASC